MTRADSVSQHEPGERRSGLVLFDGGCGLCHRSVRFILRHDSTAYFRFAPLQGTTAASVLAGAPADVRSLDTVVLVEGGGVFTRLTAAVRIAARLDSPWSLLALLRVVPRPLRDWAYEVVARHRVRWFGRADVCDLDSRVPRARLLE